MSDKETWIDSMLGPFGRLLSIGGALFDPSSLPYTAGSPVTNFGFTAANTLKKYYNQNNYDSFLASFWKTVLNITPLGSSTPLKGAILHYVNPSAEPRPGEQYQNWIQQNRLFS